MNANRFTLLLTILSLLCLGANAQSFLQGKGFAFQGYARNADGTALTNQNINIRFSIYPQGNSSNVVFTEEHTNVPTDAYGVFGVRVGAINTTSFTNMDFTRANYWLKVETKPTASGAYATINETELLSVAYAKAAANGTPPGTIISFAGPAANIPAGYLICDGALYNNVDYPNLAAAIGTSWGGTAGSNFRVPDLRGQFLRGWNTNTAGPNGDPDAGSRVSRNGSATGNNIGSYQDDINRSHNHTGTTNTTGAHTHSVGQTTISRMASDGDDGNNKFDQGSGTTRQNLTIPPDPNTGSNGDHSHTLNVDNAGGSESRPKNAMVLFLIKI